MKSLAWIILFLVTVDAGATCNMVWNCGSNPYCRSAMGGSSGQLATASQSDCESQLASAKANPNYGSLNPTAYCSCSDGAAGAGGSGLNLPSYQGTNMRDAFTYGVMKGFTESVVNGMTNNMNASPQQMTPEQLAAQQQAQAQAAAAEAARQAEIARKKQERADRLDRTAFLRMSLLDVAFNPEKTPSTNFRAKVACDEAEVQANHQYVCHVTTCGGAYNGPSVCCPAGFPKLNYCDCNCYAADADFECLQYSACNYSSRTDSVGPGGASPAKPEANQNAGGGK